MVLRADIFGEPAPSPHCPLCRGHMELRSARRPSYTTQARPPFWGCLNWPACVGTLPAIRGRDYDVQPTREKR